MFDKGCGLFLLKKCNTWLTGLRPIPYTDPVMTCIQTLFTRQLALLGGLVLCASALSARMITTITTAAP